MMKSSLRVSLSCQAEKEFQVSSVSEVTEQNYLKERIFNSVNVYWNPLTTTYSTKRRKELQINTYKLSSECLKKFSWCSRSTTLKSY